jgi:hypothetical protein
MASESHWVPPPPHGCEEVIFLRHRKPVFLYRYRLQVLYKKYFQKRMWSAWGRSLTLMLALKQVILRRLRKVEEEFCIGVDETTMVE